ncbi:MAG: tetratricopeptide repeat protein [Acidobacteria bacterium]|nr:tetratricopeptide repeat protein [Acidobacteriota bacterium]
MRRRFKLCVSAATVVACVWCSSAGVGDVVAQKPARGASPPQQQAESSIAEGIAAIKRGDEAAARTLFARALNSDPDNATAHTYLGALADRAGDLKEAERHFAAAAINAPFLASARNNYGAILMRTGRTQLAAAQFEASLKLDRNQPHALVNLAQIRFASGQPEDLRAARSLFERAYAIVPESEVARAIVIVALRLGERDAAASSYREYAAHLAAGEESKTSAVGARAELGMGLLVAGLFDEAAVELGAAVEREPSNVGAVVSLARAHLSRKDIPSAGRTLEAAVARGLDVAPVYAALAEVYEAGGYVENAIPAMRLAIARDPKNEDYQIRYGLLLTDTKAPAAAIIRLEEALREFPRSSRLWLALGIAQLNMGKNDDARRSFARSLELDPRSVPALAYLGTTHAERGQYSEAVSFYERAIAADDGRLAVPYYLAADTLLRQTEVDAPRAEKYLVRAVELDPSFAAARLALAKLHVRTERWAEAAVQFERVVQLEPGRAEAHYQLGRVYTRLKRAADAQRELATFKQLSDTQKEQKEIERRDLVRRLASVRF